MTRIRQLIYIQDFIASFSQFKTGTRADNAGTDNNRIKFLTHSEILLNILNVLVGTMIHLILDLVELTTARGHGGRPVLIQHGFTPAVYGERLT